jgi:tRNA pseudouridine38-40 synthase
MRFRLDISYNGKAFCGWQKQSDKPTVQGTLEKVLSILLRQPIVTTGCGRTDTGVHARFFTLHFDFDGPLPNYFLHRLNSLLPQDIAALNIEPVSDSFHARFSAITRTYRYYLSFGKDPFSTETSWLQHKKPNLILLNACAQLLPGIQNCKSFTKGEEPAHHGYHCHISGADWELHGQNLVFSIKANRFLRNMVRSIVGSCLEVGYEKKDINWFKGLLEGKTRSEAGRSVPAHGLFLERVEY